MIDETVKSPQRATKLRRLSGVADKLDSVPAKPIILPRKVSPIDALAFLLSTNMTKEAYVSMRLFSKSHGADIWPPYDEILAAKEECRPNDIQYTETSAIVSIPERLKQNDKRFLQLCKDDIAKELDSLPLGGSLDVEVESKVGFDGASGLSIYNQPFSTANEDTSESSLLSTCIVPLRYMVKGGKTLFLNPVPQASSFCQPIRLEFKKETPETSREIERWIDEGVQELRENPHVIDIDTRQVTFSHIVKKTMLDTKAKNSLTQTSSAQTCFLCGANPKDFNNLENFPDKFPTKKENLQYSSVCDFHAASRAFDAINSLSDKMTMEKWRVPKGAGKQRKGETEEKAAERRKREAEMAAEVEQRKKNRQRQFKEKMALVVDVPRAGGSGNSNTGNVARRAFGDEAQFAEITGVNQNLIHRLHTQIIAFNVDAQIDPEKYRSYGQGTAALWVSLYPWYPMPASVHQLCLHGHESLELSSLPISFYTEQSLESAHKYFKYDRTHHARRNSRINTITDQFNRQNDKADIIIAMMLQQRRRRSAKLDLPPDVLALLKNEEEEEEADPN